MIPKTCSSGVLRFRACALLIFTLLFSQAIPAASLEPTTLKAWEAYLDSVNIGMEQRLSPGQKFLWVDEQPERLAKVRKGELIVIPAGAQNPRRVPSGLIHHWIAAVFIPDVTLGDVLQVVRDYSRYKEFFQPAVRDSKVIANGETKDRYSMVLMHNSSFLKTAVDSDYESSYMELDARKVYSTCRSIRIQEIEEYGAPAQRTLRDGEGNGLLWRVFSTTRYVERDGGVYLEVEAIALSRDIPSSLRWIVEPIVRRVSRGSISATLRQTEVAVRSRSELAKRKKDSVAPLAHGDKVVSGFHATPSSQ